MPLWLKTDTLASAPKWLLDGANTSIYPAANTARDHGALPFNRDVNNAYFVDLTEAASATNRARGIRTAGWNSIKTYTDTNGKTRYRVIPMVPMKVSAASAGDLGVTANTTNEDIIVSDT